MLSLILTVCLLVIGVVGGLWPSDVSLPSHARSSLMEKPATDDDGVVVFIHSKAMHSDLILPVVHGSTDWRVKLPSAFANATATTETHVSFGWGDREFSLTTQKWRDVTFGSASLALLWPTEAAMHVQPLHGFDVPPVVSQSLMRVRIADQQYDRLVKAISDSFEGATAAAVPIEFPSEGRDTGEAAGHFYAATGRFSLPHNCHTWTGDTMRAAGIPVGRYTPLPQSVLWHLRAE